ncbi:hypothetical protein [Microbacterium sp. 4R-513]|uniref:hypothetical protein n=1 Tax=Microbacterium sp. 4R-513 TaxID=2567934 RepID=UPI001F49C122|nr:hypothetical protein [Microbacterium sp. 4R-513]
MPTTDRTSGTRNSPLQPTDSDSGPASTPPAGASDADDGAHGADRACHPLAGDGVADEAEREREQRAADALQDASDEQDAEVGGVERDEVADDDDDEHGEERRAAAAQVADAAQDGRRDCCGDEPGGHRPRGGVGRHPQVGLHEGDDGDDEVLKKRQGCDAEGECEERACRG